MSVPPPREHGGGEERAPNRRPADLPAPDGQALVEHLVDRLARTERELSNARDLISQRYVPAQRPRRMQEREHKSPTSRRVAHPRT